MRWIFRVLAVLAVCLVSVTLPAAPAQADDEGPYITLDPNNGVPGTSVTVHGGNFTAGKWVDIYYYLDTANTTNRIRVQEKQISTTTFTVTFTIPESCTGDHKVLAEDENGKNASRSFTVKPGLKVSPEEGPVGTSVTVEGHGFAKDETSIKLIYYLDGNSTTIATNIKADDYGWWEQSFVIPSSAKGSHKIDAQRASSSLAHVFFKVTPGISLDKLSGSVGENITITGNGFVANDKHITILFAGQEVETETISADAKGYWQESFEVPEMTKGTYTLTAEGDWTSKEDITALSFAIKPSIVLPPGEGYVGMDLSIKGHGFAASRDVVIKYDGSQVATDTTDTKGSLNNVSFPVPESQHGEHQVTADDAAGNNAIAIFTMESTPPGIPTLTSPSNGTRVGFIGQVRPTFEWSEVSDLSGVRYNLQIAKSANVTTAGNFTDPLVSVPNIVGTNYTLNATEALSYGTYYWIVQAVDRAANVGKWTANHSFRAGLLPMWGFIAAIVAIVVLIGALVYFLVIRRRKTPYY
jgi:hypothetical protein